MVEQDIYTVLRYFAQFWYAPTVTEVWVFLAHAVTRGEFQKVVDKLITEQKLTSFQLHISKQTSFQGFYPNEKRIIGNFDTWGGYQNDMQIKIRNSVTLLKRNELYVSVLSQLSCIELIGISGSTAMLNAKNEDDVDIFIITAEKRLWTGRLAAVMAADILGRRRKRFEEHPQGKLCLNLFFDGSDISIPQEKQTPFVAHELLQMKPVFDRGVMYATLLEANSWVFTYYPNAKELLHTRSRTSSTNVYEKKKEVTANILERWSRTIQLRRIQGHTTSERISDTQLWFFPDDFEKKIRYNP